MRTHLDPESLENWAMLALADMRTHRRAIDALNVFPVPDGDTGTNMYLTLESGVDAMKGAGGTGNAGEIRLAALARGMLLGARGNSGIIASEFVRGVAATQAEDRTRPLDGAWLADAVDRGARAAFAAVASPKEGTVLTVARVAAEAAATVSAETGGDLLAVAQAIASSAREALAATTDQLEALRRAGVVDAGGRGFVVLTDAMLEAVTGEHRDLPEFPRLAAEPDSLMGPEDTLHGYGGPAYEVMYLLDADDEAVPHLRMALARLGDSLVVVGGDRLWNVHVHVDDAGAAVEAALAVGRPHRIRITYLADVVLAGRLEPARRSLVVVTHGQGVTDLLEASGVTTVRAPELGRPSMQEMLEGIRATGAEEVVLLPSDKDSQPVAESAALAARDVGHRVAVIPTRSIVQSLAAVAVHDAEGPFDDDVVAMTQAASATNYGGLTTASRQAMTTAGLCQIGDELGVISGEILEIGSDPGEVAERVLARMLGRGGAELVTVVLGASASQDLLERIERWTAKHHPGVEVVGYEGGQPNWHAILGVE